MPRKKALTWETEQAAFPSRLSTIMKERKVSQETLAAAIGVKRQTISLYKTGQSSPNIEQLYKIAKYFDVSADWLLGIVNVQSNDTTIKAVCEYTGFSEKGIQNLRDFALVGVKGADGNPVLGEALNDLVSSPAFRDLVPYLFRYRSDIKNFVALSKSPEGTTDAEGLDAHYYFDSASLWEFHASKALASIFDDIRYSEMKSDPELIKEYGNGNLWRTRFFQSHHCFDQNNGSEDAMNKK